MDNGPPPSPPPSTAKKKETIDDKSLAEDSRPVSDRAKHFGTQRQTRSLEWKEGECASEEKEGTCGSGPKRISCRPSAKESRYLRRYVKQVEEKQRVDYATYKAAHCPTRNRFSQSIFSFDFLPKSKPPQNSSTTLSESCTPSQPKTNIYPEEQICRSNSNENIANIDSCSEDSFTESKSLLRTSQSLDLSFISNCEMKVIAIEIEETKMSQEQSPDERSNDPQNTDMSNGNGKSTVNQEMAYGSETVQKGAPINHEHMVVGECSENSATKSEIQSTNTPLKFQPRDDLGGSENISEILLPPTRSRFGFKNRRLVKGGRSSTMGDLGLTRLGLSPRGITEEGSSGLLDMETMAALDMELDEVPALVSQDIDQPVFSLYRQNSLGSSLSRRRCVVRLDGHRYTIGKSFIPFLYFYSIYCYN